MPSTLVIKVTNKNGSLQTIPSYVPTVETQAVSDLSTYAKSSDMLANTAAAYSNAVAYANTAATNAYTNAIAGISSAAATAYANATANAAALYQVAADLAGNVAILTSNNTIYFDGVSLATINTAITSNSATAYSNATAYADTKAATAYTNATAYADTRAATAYTNATTYASNATNISTGTLATARLPSTVNVSAINLGANVNLTTTSISVGNSTVNAVVSAGSLTINGVSVATAITGNAATAYTNATTFASNATNISTGTLATARLPATANITTAINVGANVNLTTSVVNVGNATVNTRISAGNVIISGTDLGTAITGNASTAYTNATTFASNATNISTGTLATARLPATANIATAINVGANVNLGTTTINVGNATVNTVVSAGNVVVSGIDLSTAITGNASTAYTNATTYASNATNISTGTLANARLPATANITTAVNVGANVNLTTSSINVGNATVNTIITSGNVIISGTDLGTAITSNAATAYSNAVANAAALYQTTAGLAANVATLTANAANFLGNSSGTLANIASWVTGNAATAYSNATTYSSNATNLSTGTVAEARLPFRMDQNVRTTDAVSFGSVTISGNLTVNGTYTVISGNSVTFTDNMIYLNQGVLATITNVSGNGSYVVFTANNNYQVGWDVTITGVDPSSYNGTYVNIYAANATSFTVANTNTASYVSGGTARGKSEANPDLGFAAGYNDGTYHHAGFFRDHTSGVWKVYDGYLPEPDESVYIDQTNSSFTIAPFQAYTVYVGNNTVYGTINATHFTGTSNNSTNLGGSNLAIITGYITGNAATAYSNAIAYADNKAANAYSNATAYADTKAATAYSNATAYADTKAATAYSNATAYTDTKAGQAYSNAVANAAALYQTTAGLAANVATLTANNSNNLGGVAAASYVNTSGAYTISGVHTHNANIVFGTSAVIIANGALGTSGQVLTSNGSGMYWATASAGVNTDAQYTWSNTQTFNANVIINNDKNLNFKTANGNSTVGMRQQTDDNFVFYTTNTSGGARAVFNVYANTNAPDQNSSFRLNTPLDLTNQGIYANNTLGSAGQVLLTNGSTVYWDAAPGGGGGTVTQVNTGIGLSGGPITTSGTISVLANSGIVANASGVFVNTSYIATLDANNATYFSGVSLATVNSAITGNAATAYSNATAYADTKAGEAYSNATTYASNATNISTGTLATARLPSTVNVSAINLGSNVNLTTSYINVGNSTVNTDISAGAIALSGIDVATAITGNAATAYTNATAFSANATNINSGTLATARLPATANISTAINVGANINLTTSTINVGNATVNTVVSSGNVSLSGIDVATAITGNAATAYSNATTYASNATNITTGTLATARLPATANISTAINVGANVNLTTSAIAVGNSTVNSTINSTTIAVTAIYANSSNGSSGDVLYSNGTGIYWAAAPAGGGSVNTAAQYSWTNTHTFSANVAMTGWLDVESYVETDAAPTISAGSLTLDLATATVFDVSLNASVTSLMISNVPATASKVVSFTLILTADGTARTVAWPGAFKWPSGTAPTITSTLNKKDVFVFFSTDNGTSWNAFISGQNL